MTHIRRLLKFALVVIGVGVLTYSLHMGVGQSAYIGTDNKAVALIQTQVPSYQPWMAAWWSPESAEDEALLFALQAMLGTGVLALAWWRLGWVRRLHGRTGRC